MQSPSTENVIGVQGGRVGMLLLKENQKNLNTKEAVVAGNSKKKKRAKKIKERKRLRRANKEIS